MNICTLKRYEKKFNTKNHLRNTKFSKLNIFFNLENEVFEIVTKYEDIDVLRYLRISDREMIYKILY